MTAKEDKKTPARVGRVPGLILAQLWGRPSLAGLPEWCLLVYVQGIIPFPPQREQELPGHESVHSGHLVSPG